MLADALTYTASRLPVFAVLLLFVASVAVATLRDWRDGRRPRR
jgi:hypothetical protein